MLTQEKINFQREKNYSKFGDDDDIRWHIICNEINYKKKSLALDTNTQGELQLSTTAHEEIYLAINIIT